MPAYNLTRLNFVNKPGTTAIYPIYKETKSAKWTTVASLLPVVMGFVMCFVLTQVWLLLS